MDEPEAAVTAQAAYWGGEGGRRWVELQGLLDGTYQPLAARLVEAVVAAGAGGRVLDVGCGTGATTVALARRLGGGCTGVDVSEPMLDAARERAAREGMQVRFVLADAQRHRFEPGSFDVVASRFGVMFFDDPVEAFTNLRSAVRSGGSLRMIVWRTVDENPFMATAAHAAEGLVEIPPPPAPGAPGPYSLADPDRVTDIFERGGWTDIDVQPIDVACAMAEADLPRYVGGLGTLGRVLVGADAATRERIVNAVLPAYGRFLDGGQVRFLAACWLLSAMA